MRIGLKFDKYEKSLSLWFNGLNYQLSRRDIGKIVVEICVNPYNVAILPLKTLCKMV